MNGVDFDLMLEWHLAHNHYPAVPQIMFDACREAIECGNSENWEEDIALPDGFLFLGKGAMKAWQVVETFHLDGFVEAPSSRSA